MFKVSQGKIVIHDEETMEPITVVILTPSAAEAASKLGWFKIHITKPPEKESPLVGLEKNTVVRVRVNRVRINDIEHPIFTTRDVVEALLIRSEMLAGQTVRCHEEYYRGAHHAASVIRKQIWEDRKGSDGVT